jgi:hypothetical protein
MTNTPLSLLLALAPVVKSTTYGEPIAPQGTNPPPATNTFRPSFLQVPRSVKVASRAACMDFLVWSRVALVVLTSENI